MRNLCTIRTWYYATPYAIPGMTHNKTNVLPPLSCRGGKSPLTLAVRTTAKGLKFGASRGPPKKETEHRDNGHTYARCGNGGGRCINKVARDPRGKRNGQNPCGCEIKKSRAVFLK